MPATTQTTRKKWFGTTTCDLCHESCGFLLIDGQTTMGPWACMCEECFKESGRGIGPGVGQLYEQFEGEYTKVGG